MNTKIATLIVRARGLHLDEAGIYIEGQRIAGAFFDAGMYLFLNRKQWKKDQKGARLYIPKLESAREAQLWADFLEFSEDYLNIAKESTKVTVLIETIFGALEMEEILYALRKYIVALNAGRWDYIFSIIKRFKSYRKAILPDRGLVTMAVPFMSAYCHRLVNVCHKRHAYAIGGMAANIPSRVDAAANEKALKLVHEDKIRELKIGFDGTWVAHPDLVSPVRKLFVEHLKNNKNQLQVIPKLPNIEELLHFDFDPTIVVTTNGIRTNISAALQYISYWIYGKGAVAIDNKMEDAATAEISRAQLWQWIKWGTLVDGQTMMSKEYYLSLKAEIITKLMSDTKFVPKQHLPVAAGILDSLVLNTKFEEFLTLPAYEYLLGNMKSKSKL